MILKLAVPLLCNMVIATVLCIIKKTSFGMISCKLQRLAVKNELCDEREFILFNNKSDEKTAQTKAKITVTPNKKSLGEVCSFGQDLTERLAVVPKVANRVNITIDEIYSNIVNYSGADIAEIECKIADNKLMIIFTDNGAEYNPIDTKKPDITLSADKREIGCLGIFMVGKLTERMEYKYENGKNVLKVLIPLV